MDSIKKLRVDKDLSDKMCDVCDIEILPKFKNMEMKKSIYPIVSPENIRQSREWK